MRANRTNCTSVTPDMLAKTPGATVDLTTDDAVLDFEEADYRVLSPKKELE